MDQLLKGYAPDLLNKVMKWLRANRSNLPSNWSDNDSRMLLIDSGLDKYADPATLSELLAQSIEPVEGGLPSARSQAINKVMNDWTVEIGHVAANSTEQLTTLIRSVRTTPRTIAQLTTEVQGITGLLKSRALTVANTALAQAQRRVSLEGAKTIPPNELVFVYQGPENDAIIRPFCNACVDLAFTKAQINRLDNGQGLSVITNGGGWNCRHTWQPMPRSAAIAGGFEVASDMDVQRANSAAR